MIKKWLNIVVVLCSVLLLASCSLELRAEQQYVSVSEVEQIRIDMIADVEESVVVVKTDTGHGSGIIFKVDEAVGGGGQGQPRARQDHRARRVREDGGFG